MGDGQWLVHNAGPCPPVNLTNVRALRDLGLDETQRRAFFNGEVSLFEIPSRTPGQQNLLAGIDIESGRLRIGIIGHYNDAGTGALDVLAFRQRVNDIAKQLGYKEVEIYGGAFVNSRYEALAQRLGFQYSYTINVGGSSMPIRSTIIKVR